MSKPEEKIPQQVEMTELNNKREDTEPKSNQSLKSSEYLISSYDEHCEEYSRIEKIVPLRKSNCKFTLLIILNICTVCLIDLFIMWFPTIKLYLIYSVCELKDATYVGIYGSDKKFYIEEMKHLKLPELPDSPLKKTCKINIDESDIIVLFIFKLFSYVYDPKTSTFKGFEFSIKENQDKILETLTNGLNDTEVSHQKQIFGICDLIVRIPSVLMLLIIEFSDPFYIFQLFSVILWYCNYYAYYATVIIVATIVSLATSVWESRTSLKCIQSMARYSCKVNVFRRGAEGKKEPKMISSIELVPGDLFEIPEDGYALPCDCILTSGTVIVNESMLTGESTPIIKNHMQNVPVMFDGDIDPKNVLFAGTKIVQKRALSNQRVMGIVYKIGFDTVKGNLIRSILFPKEVAQNFKADSLKYIIVMAILSLVGFLISLPFLLNNAGLDGTEVGLKFLDLITTTVPPALPTCLGVGVTYALGRLKDGKIICINRERVNIVGKINMICFDKTGTLTEDHLDIAGYRPIVMKENKFVFDDFQKNADSYTQVGYTHYKEKSKKTVKDKTKDLKQLFVECLATCHGITTVKGKLIGDPIDVKMFQSCGWVLKENVENKNNYDSLVLAYVRPKSEVDIHTKLTDNIKAEETSDNPKTEDQILKEHYELGIVRRFDFSSKLQRMTTLVKDQNEKFFKAFCKGSPEKVKELCKPDTVPENFNEILAGYTSKGLRVLAMATKFIKMDFTQAQKVSQDFVEKNMIFLGLLIVQNKLKKATKASIQTLDEAHLRMVMATGDNILTAISVSKECKLIPNNVKIYSCELVKEGKEANTLVWNAVENFEENTEIHTNTEKGVMSLSGGNESKCFEEKFPPESFYDDMKNTHIEGENHEIDDTSSKNEIKGRIDSEVINIEDNSTPFKDGEDFVIAITGSTLEQLFKKKKKFLETNDQKYKLHYDTFRTVLRYGYIFARMAPEHKTLLVENLREENFNVMMCGDGANDCGALRAADVGVSLSPEEASIAAHFTSKIPDISCLITLLREGKASLVTSIQTFKYMMMYSFIQFFSVTLLMIYQSYLSDSQFLVSDIFIIFPLAFFIAQTGSYEKLTYDIPTSSLLSVPIISSIVIHMLLSFIFQFGGNLILMSTDWHVNTCELDGNTVFSCADNSTLFLIANLQYLTSALTFSMDKPYRKPFYTNRGLVAYLVIAIFISIYIIVAPAGWTKKLLVISDYEDDNFKYWVLVITIVNFIVDYCVEKFLIYYIEVCWNNHQLKKLKGEMKMNPTKGFKLSEYQRVANYDRVLKEEKEKK